MLWRDAIAAERESLALLRDYDVKKCKLDKALTAVLEYEALLGVKKSYADLYKRTLEAAYGADALVGYAPNTYRMAISSAEANAAKPGIPDLSVLAEKMKSIHAAMPRPLERTASGR